MSPAISILERRVRVAGIMISFALMAMLASLLIFHPLSFVGFALFGVVVMIVANVYFLIAIIRGDRVSAPVSKKV